MESSSSNQQIIPLGILSLTIAWSFVALIIIISLYLKIKLESQIIWASIRCVIQLLILGYILEPIFNSNNALIVLTWCLGMIIMATNEAAGRSTRTYPFLFFNTLIAMAISTIITSLVGMIAVNVSPLWRPDYLIPILGMLLNNALNGITLGLDRCLQKLDEDRDRIHLLLAFGATKDEASHDVLAQATRIGLIPTINTMSVMGLVSIPGMMTGQILGGATPLTAAKYQIFIVFLIAGASSLGSIFVILLTTYVLFDKQHRLRNDWITPNKSFFGQLKEKIFGLFAQKSSSFITHEKQN